MEGEHLERYVLNLEVKPARSCWSANLHCIFIFHKNQSCRLTMLETPVLSHPAFPARKPCCSSSLWLSRSSRSSLVPPLPQSLLAIGVKKHSKPIDLLAQLLEHWLLMAQLGEFSRFPQPASSRMEPRSCQPKQPSCVLLSLETPSSALHHSPGCPSLLPGVPPTPGSCHGRISDLTPIRTRMAEDRDIPILSNMNSRVPVDSLWIPMKMRNVGRGNCKQ